jgi:cytoskeleton protein RodZ
MIEQQPDKTQEQFVEEPTLPSVGSTLREAREHMGLTVEDVVNRLKFAPRQIRALEADSFEQLPEGAFLRGLVRSYARLLQLDEAPLLETLPGTGSQESGPAEVQPSVEVPFPGVYSARKSNIIWLTAALLVALVLGLFTWLYGHKPAILHVGTVTQSVQLPSTSAASSVPAAPVPAPVAVPAAEQHAAPPAAVSADTGPKIKFHDFSGPGPIRMVFDEDAWVEIRDKDGNVLMSQVNPAGSVQTLGGDPPFALTIGHASSVKLYYKDKQIDLAPNTHAEVAHVTLE